MAAPAARDEAAEDPGEARRVKVLTSPAGPTRKEREEHEVTHLPFRDWCIHCIRGGGIAAPHCAPCGDEHVIPTVSIDFYHMGSEDQSVAPMLAVKERKTKDGGGSVFSHALESKEVSEHNIKVLKQDIEYLGLKRFIFKSDGEPAIVALKRAVAKELAHCEILPEESPVDDHQGNGDIEVAIRELEKMIRILKDAMEARMGRAVEHTHPVLTWLPAHAAFIITRFAVSKDGKTAFERSRGKPYRRELLPFGERALFMPIKRGTHMNKMDSRWSTGRFVGCVPRTNEVLMMTKEGVERARTVRRMEPSERWNLADWDELRGVPWNLVPAPGHRGQVRPVIVQVPDGAPPVPPAAAAAEGLGLPRRLYIRRDDVIKYGATLGCPGCEAVLAGAQPKGHTEVCRERITKAMDADEGGRKRIEEAKARMGAERATRRRLEEPGGDTAGAGAAADATSSSHFGSSGAAASSSAAAAPGASSGRGPDEFQVDQGRSGDLAMDTRTSMKRQSETQVEELDTAAAQASQPAELSGLEREVSELFAEDAWQANRAELSSIAHDLRRLGRREGDDVAEVYSPPRMCPRARSFGLRPGFSIDLCTEKPSGGFWDLSRPADMEEAEKLIEHTLPYVLIGSPPCDPFSQLQYLNDVRRTPQQAAEVRERGRVHLNNSVRLYEGQMRNHLYFLHEHPKTATSWSESSVRDLASRKGVYYVEGPMCRWGMVATDSRGTAPVLKETGWLTNSPVLAKRLAGVCSNKHSSKPWHRHVGLINGRSAEARIYPPRLVAAILRGVREQLRLDGEIMGFENYPVPTEADFTYDKQEDEEQLEEFWDDVHGGFLDPAGVKRARSEELAEVRKHGVYFTVPLSLCWEETGRGPITLRWVDTNKGSLEEPELRSRLVVRELKRLNTTMSAHELFASMPPLEMLKFLLSLAVTKRTSKNGKPLKLGFADIRRAHFHAQAVRRVFVNLPEEEYQPGMCGLLCKSMYGTQDAPACWEREYSDMFVNSAAFKQGVACPALFRHEGLDAYSLVHGDDFVTLGDDDAQKHLAGHLDKRYEWKNRGILGPELGDAKRIKILNRYVTWKDDCGMSYIEYEADPRHVSLIVSQLNIENAKAVSTPCIKKRLQDVLTKSPTLGKEQATAYRSIVMRASYLGQDRADIQVAVKELARAMKEPTERDWTDLKRLGRFLLGRPRVVLRFKQQRWQGRFDLYVDSDHAGCLATRKSTTGLALMHGSHCLRTQSIRQSNIALSSGEAEFGAIVKGASSGLGSRSYASDLGLDMEAHLHSDAVAGIAMAERRGLGEARHVATRYLWVQERVREKEIRLHKEPTETNLGDLLTKPMEKYARIEALMKGLGQHYVDARQT